MKRRTIKHILKDRFDTINHIFDSFAIHIREKNVHLFRLEIKKMAGFLSLVNMAIVNSPPIGLPKKIKAFYKRLGAIRNLQILEQRILKTAANQSLQPAAYLKKLANKIKKNKKRVRHFSKLQNRFKKEEKDLLRKMPARISRQGKMMYVRMKLKTLQIHTAPGMAADESMHTIRKSLKDLLYTWPYIKKEASLYMTPSGYPNGKNSLTLSLKLGNLQDMCAGIDLLKHEVYKGKMGEKQQAILDNLSAKWFTDKETEKKMLQGLLQKTFPGLPDGLSFEMIVDNA